MSDLCDAPFRHPSSQEPPTLLLMNSLNFAKRPTFLQGNPPGRRCSCATSLQNPSMLQINCSSRGMVKLQKSSPPQSPCEGGPKPLATCHMKKCIRLIRLFTGMLVSSLSTKRATAATAVRPVPLHQAIPGQAALVRLSSPRFDQDDVTLCSFWAKRDERLRTVARALQRGDGLWSPP